MKKFIKRLILLLIILGCLIGIYYYKDETVKQIQSISENLNNLEILGFTENNNEIYSQAEIEEIINSTQNNVNGEYKGKIDNYYYNQLNSNSKIIYRVFKDNIENLKTGTYDIRLPSKLEETLKQDGGQEKLNQDFQDAWDAFKLDTPEIYYINVKKMCLMTKTITRGLKVNYELYIQNQTNENSLADGFYSKQDVEAAMSKIQKVKEDIVKDIPNNDFAKVVYVHNWIIDNVKYDVSLNKADNSNIYGALVKKEVVCEGYAKALIDFIVERYGKQYAILQVGTGDSPLTIPFYEKCGFARSHSIPHFFTDNYDHPIYEDGVQLVDMIYLRRRL